VDAQYELLEKLGDGGMGSVYRARDKRLNRIVAIKVLKAGGGRDTERQRRFILEAQAASALNHPNIITIHDLAFQDGEQMMVMECVAGRSLSELIRDQPLPVELVAEYGAQIADALATAHAAGIVHRDLKPSNVMVNDRGLVKVLDFGLAKLVGPDVSDSDATRSGVALTVEGTLLGTVAYMSPEQAQGKTVDARADIFSFGAMLYEMVTGKPAFGSSNPISTLTAILRDEARPIPELTPNVPTELQGVVYYCLRKQPEERYQSMAQVRDALLALRRSYQPEPPRAAMQAPPPAPQPLPAPPAVDARAAVFSDVAPAPATAPAKKSHWAFPLAALALVALGGGGWFLWSRLHQPSTQVAQTPPATNPPAANPPASTTPVPPPNPPQTGTPTPTPTPANPPTSQGTKPEPPPPTKPAPTAAAKPVVVRDGTPLRLSLAQAVASDAPVATPLSFVVAADLVVNGDIVIAKGATAKGVIVEAGKKRRILRDLKPTYRIMSVEAIDGKQLRLRTTPAKSGDEGKRPMIGTAQGTEFPAYIDGDVTVEVRAP
jgi:serine/threonine protein kinase